VYQNDRQIYAVRVIEADAIPAIPDAMESKLTFLAIMQLKFDRNPCIVCPVSSALPCADPTLS
jgi:hypothetical protein